MDDPDVSPGELASNFDDIEFANRHFGGVAALARAVERRGARSILDVGCGSGDVARALVRRAQARGTKVIVTGLDRSESVLAIARERSSGLGGLIFVHGEGERLPFADASFDVAMCSLTLHHCEPPAAPALLAELRRVAAIAPIVCDLQRSWPAYLATRAYAAVLARNRLTKHDAPLSVRRAYTRREAWRLAREAGWSRPRVRALPFFRFLLTDDAVHA